MLEHEHGAWIRYDDAMKRIAELESYISKQEKEWVKPAQRIFELEAHVRELEMDKKEIKWTKEERIAELEETNWALKKVTREWRQDAERFRALLDEHITDGEIAICKAGAYGMPWVAIGPNEAIAIIDAARGER